MRTIDSEYMAKVMISSLNEEALKKYEAWLKEREHDEVDQIINELINKEDKL